MFRFISIFTLLSLLTVSLFAQSASNVSGVVFDQNNAAVVGATVELVDSSSKVINTTTTNQNGEFSFEQTSGATLIKVSAAGFQSFQTDDIDGRVVVRLNIEPLSQVVQVSATENDFVTENATDPRSIEERAPRDLMDALREEPGVNAVRRGQINLEPQIRGLAENQVGMFVDGTRTFAAGPARMDSDLSHVSLHDLQEVIITKGPYALTAGAGTMSAVQVRTFSPPFYSDDFEIHGRGGFNYGENGVFRDGFGTVWAGNDRFRGSLSHNLRQGNDYNAGDGSVVRGDFLSNDTRASFGLKPSNNTFIEYKFGFQQQEDVDYEGRLLDATYFITRSHAVKFDYTPVGGAVNQVFARPVLQQQESLDEQR